MPVRIMNVPRPEEELSHKETWSGDGLGNTLGELNLGSDMTVDIDWMMMRDQ
jgi:hypothetical protein